MNSILHKNSFHIYLDINQWEKIVAVEIVEKNSNMAHPNWNSIPSSANKSPSISSSSSKLLDHLIARELKASPSNAIKG